MLGGAELRYNVSRVRSSSRAFSTWATSTSRYDDIDLGALRRSAGLGVRYRTPIGPIRLDWGYVLDHQPGESRSRFHLTIGHAF